MASIIAVFSVFMVVCAGHTSKDFITVQCKPVNTGQVGQQSLLECVISTSQEVSDPEIRIVTWKKQGNETSLLVFDKGNLSNRDGYKFADPRWDKKSMNVSLLISSTAVKDEGEYTCMVFTDSGHNKGTTKLTVTARYNEPTITSNSERKHQGDRTTLNCIADGGYPQGRLQWFVGSEEYLTEDPEKPDRQNGLYRLSSHLSLLPGSPFPSYTCVVFNASGGKEGEATFVVPDMYKAGNVKEIPSKIVAPVVVIGSVIVGLLLLLLFLRRRSQNGRRPSQVPLMVQHEEVSTGELEADMCDVEKGACQ